MGGESIFGFDCVSLSWGSFLWGNFLNVSVKLPSLIHFEHVIQILVGFPGNADTLVHSLVNIILEVGLYEQT